MSLVQADGLCHPSIFLCRHYLRDFLGGLGVGLFFAWADALTFGLRACRA